MSFQIMAKNDGEFTTSTCVQIVYEWGMEGARLIARGRTRTRKAPRTNTDAYTKTHTTKNAEIAFLLRGDERGKIYDAFASGF